jgi:hypothetical protein
MYPDRPIMEVERVERLLFEMQPLLSTPGRRIKTKGNEMNKRHHLLTGIFAGMAIFFLFTISSSAYVNQKKEIVFIDASVPQKETLINGLRDDVELISLSGDEDGIVQIASAVKKYGDLDAIHVISHGVPGRVFLGTGVLSSGSLEKYDPQLRTIAASLKKDGALLLYGCEVAKTSHGRDFIRGLRASVHAHVAASTDLTGNTGRGGNWTLEFSDAGKTPDLPVDARSLTAYQGMLFYIDHATVPTTALLVSDLDDIANGNAATVDAVASLPNGKIALFINTYNSGYTALAKSYVRVVTSSGATVFTTEITASMGARLNNAYQRKIYGLSSGNVVVTWEGTNSGCDNNTSNLFQFIIINSSGTISTATTNVSQGTGPYNCYTGAAELSNGNVAFFYQWTGEAYNLRVFNTSGASVAGPLTVAKPTCTSSFSHSMAANSNGKFMLLSDCTGYNKYYGVLYNNDGTVSQVGGANTFDISAVNKGGAAQSKVTALSDNNFAVIYMAEPGADYTSRELRRRIVQSNGALGTEVIGPVLGLSPIGNIRGLKDGGFVHYRWDASKNAIADLYDNSGASLETNRYLDSTAGEPDWDVIDPGKEQGFLYWNYSDYIPNIYTMHKYNYTASPPTVTGVSPSSGPTAGGTSVTITGTSLTGATAVKFGATNASITANTATSITATSPAGTPGSVDITVVTTGGTSATGASDQFTYAAVPTVTNISPASGPIAGGTSVIITGSNLLAATAVKFGGTNASGYTVNSATQITATAPASAPGVVDITVVTAGGTSDTSSADQFSYVTAPTVTTQAASVIAATSATGNGNITATNGANATTRGVIYYLYTNTDLVSGGIGVTDISEAGNFTTGAFTASLTPLAVNSQYNARAYATSPNGTGYGARVAFWTLANVPSAPTVNNPTATTLDVAVNANSNPSSTEFCIQETGTGNFVQSGGTLGASAIWQTAASWGTKTVTGLTTGSTYTFQVKARNGGSTETAYGATASGVPITVTVTGINPSSGPVAGGTPVTITGTSFTGATGVTIGGVAATSITVSNATTITATTPAGTAGARDVVVTTPLGSGTGAGIFTYIATPVATAVSSVTATGFSANWNAVTGATGYRLDVATDPGFTCLVSSFNNLDVGNVITKAVTGLAPFTTYHCRVRAYDSGGAGGSSDTIMVTTFTGGITAILVNPDTPASICAALDGAGIRLSADGGGTWSAATAQTANSRIKGLVMHPTTRTSLFAASYGSGLFKSTTSGDTWTACDNTGLSGAALNAVSMAIDPNGTLYVGTEGGIFTSSNCSSWNSVNNGLTVDTSTPPVSVVIDPNDAAIIYAGLDGAGIFRSSDSGGNWTAATGQPTNLRVKALVIKPGDSTKLFAATYGGGVYQSANSGVGWDACDNTNLTNLNLVSLTIDATGRLYAGTEAGVFVSSDNCASWNALNTGLPL